MQKTQRLCSPALKNLRLQLPQDSKGRRRQCRANSGYRHPRVRGSKNLCSHLCSVPFGHRGRWQPRRFPATASSEAAGGAAPVESSPGRAAAGSTDIPPRSQGRKHTRDKTIPLSRAGPSLPRGLPGRRAYLGGWASSPPQGKRGRQLAEPPQRACCPCSLEKASSSPHT